MVAVSCCFFVVRAGVWLAAFPRLTSFRYRYEINRGKPVGNQRMLGAAIGFARMPARWTRAILHVCVRARMRAHARVSIRGCSAFPRLTSFSFMFNRGKLAEH